MFNSRAAKLLAPGEHMTIVECPGLRLLATETRRTWTYRYRSPVDGKLRQTKLGEWPAMSFADAMVEWGKARQARAAGADVVADKRAERKVSRSAAARASESKVYTVRRLAEDYLTQHVENARKAKGAAEVRRMFDTMLGKLNDVPAAALTRTQAFTLIQSYANIPVQAAKLKQEMGAAWDHALDAGKLPDTTPNHWRSLMRGKLKSKGKTIEGKAVGTAKRVLKGPEVGELIRWLPNFSRIVSDALTLYLWTGARGAEIVAMEAQEITEEAEGLWWTVPKAKTKNARHAGATDLRVPLVGRAEEVVRRRLALNPKGYLFKSRSAVGHIEQKAIGVAVWYHMPYSKTRPDDERPRLTVTHWAPHDLRRTVRTALTALGCRSDVAEAVIGHMQPGIEGVYNLHEYDVERRQWLTALSAHLEGLAKRPAAASLTLVETHTTPSPRAPASRRAVR
jgi:integrase